MRQSAALFQAINDEAFTQILLFHIMGRAGEAGWDGGVALDEPDGLVGNL